MEVRLDHRERHVHDRGVDHEHELPQEHRDQAKPATTLGQVYRSIRDANFHLDYHDDSDNHSTQGRSSGYTSRAVPAPRSIPHITRLSRRVYTLATPAQIGLTLKQLYTLIALRDRGELPQQMLCDLLHTTQNTVVAWLNELEDAGLIERNRDPDDRRKHNVAITAAGGAALDRAETELRRMEDEVLAGLTSDERTQLRKLLAKALDTAP